MSKWWKIMRNYLIKNNLIISKRIIINKQRLLFNDFFMFLLFKEKIIITFVLNLIIE